jgi:hypothetical protein
MTRLSGAWPDAYKKIKLIVRLVLHTATMFLTLDDSIVWCMARRIQENKINYQASPSHCNNLFDFG